MGLLYTTQMTGKLPVWLKYFKGVSQSHNQNETNVGYKKQDPVKVINSVTRISATVRPTEY